MSDLDDATSWLISHAQLPGAGVPVRLANAYCVALANQRRSYLDVLNGPGVNFPDGTPVARVLAMRAKESPTLRAPERVRGPSLFESTLERGQEFGIRHFFLGSTAPTMALLLRKIHERYPDAIVAGSSTPPFGPVDEKFLADQASEIAQAAPHIVWVGMGTPKQDMAAAALSDRTGVCCVGVGAAFDFLAGSIDEAPTWIQNSGIEWLYRFAKEPRRLWRRYTVGNIQFARAVFADRARLGHQRFVPSRVRTDDWA